MGAAEGGLKQVFGLKGQCCAFNMQHKLIQSNGWAKTGSLLPHIVLFITLMAEKYILVAQQHW